MHPLKSVSIHSPFIFVSIQKQDFIQFNLNKRLFGGTDFWRQNCYENMFLSSLKNDPITGDLSTKFLAFKLFNKEHFFYEWNKNTIWNVLMFTKLLGSMKNMVKPNCDVKRYNGWLYTQSFEKTLFIF